MQTDPDPNFTGGKKKRIGFLAENSCSYVYMFSLQSYNAPASASSSLVPCSRMVLGSHDGPRRCARGKWQSGNL